jgi:hypothetical protein
MEDNTFFWVKSQWVGQQTKHIGICWHYIQKLYKGKGVDFNFVHWKLRKANLYKEYSGKTPNADGIQPWRREVEQDHLRNQESRGPEGGCCELE